MKIGDKVRLLKGTEEGTIARFIDNNLIEVEIEDGFSIPVMKREVVLVSTVESDYFGVDSDEEKKEEIIPAKLSGRPGLFLAFVPINDFLLSVHFINNLESDVLFSISSKSDDKISGILAEKIKGPGALKILELNKSEFEKWPLYHLELMFFKVEKHTANPPLVKEIKLKASTLFRSYQQAPVLQKQAYIYQINT